MIFFCLHPSEAMMNQRRILGIALSVMLASLAWAEDTRAAGKHKNVRRGAAATKWSTRSPAKAPVLGRETSGSSGSAEEPSSKAGAPVESRPGNAQTPLRESVRQESRIEFDERMLRGQSAAGVIYLFQRTPSDWKSIVEVPDSFRARTINLVAPVEEKK
jgi:hypothetical protein